MTIRVDTSQLDRKLDKMERGFGKHGALRDIAEYAARVMEQETRAALAGGYDPNTRAPWPPRKGNQSWPALNRSGTFAGLLGSHAKVLEYAAWAKTTIANKPLPRVGARQTKTTTYQNLAFAHFWGNENLARRRFFLEWGSRRRRVAPPAWLRRKVKAESVRAVRRIVG